MPRKKDFDSKIPLTPQPAGRTKGQPKLRTKNSAQTSVYIGENTSSHRNYCFAIFYDGQIDEVTRACQQVIEIRLVESKLARATIASYCMNGMATFLPFCQAWSAAQRRPMVLEDITRELIDSYIHDLKNRDTRYGAKKQLYDCTKSVLRAMGRFGWIEDGCLFPRNPFPNSHRKTKGEKSLSPAERQRVVQALKGDLRAVLDGSDPMTRYELGLCMLAIGVRSGINPTPLIELTTDCIQPHPLKSNRSLLVFYKRRGNSTHIQPLRSHAEVERMTTVMPDVAVIIEAVKQRNGGLRAGTDNSASDIFVYESRSNSNKEAICRVSTGTLRMSIQSWVKHHDLADDSGQRLRLNLMRLRKTFENRIWLLSGQAPWVTAKMGGHTLKVSESHYLEAPPEAEKEFAFVGEIRSRELLQSAKVGNLPAENTPVSKCRDSLNGQHAPKGAGEHCTNFLACVRCRTFVVTEEDLHLLYSFYWLLVRERDRIGARKWSRYFAHIVRIIDNEIAPRFATEVIQAAKASAKEAPHPFWRDPELLELAV